MMIMVAVFPASNGAGDQALDHDDYGDGEDKDNDDVDGDVYRSGGVDDDLEEEDDDIYIFMYEYNLYFNTIKMYDLK